MPAEEVCSAQEYLADRLSDEIGLTSWLAELGQIALFSIDRLVLVRYSTG